MNEDFLHYLWKSRQFNHKLLTTTEGESIDILHPGSGQPDAGPDFFNAQVRIDDTLWAGNIEIHIKSSDWLKHQHQKDPSYDKVILHVVWEHDKIIKRKNGVTIPTLELKGKVSREIVDKYNQLSIGVHWIPCEKDIETVPIIQKRALIDRLLVERLEQKSERIKQIHSLNREDWEATLYQLLAKYFGFKVNAVPFELIATSLPFSVLRKYQTNAIQVEALLFGQAGFLSGELKGSYPLSLKREYEFLSNKHQLKAIDQSIWKFMRMRPSNFPTVRIAQFANLISKHIGLFQKIREVNTLKELKTTLEVETHAYWYSHYRFDVPASKQHEKKMGKTSIDLLIINVIIPILFTYASLHGNDQLKECVLEYLHQISAERNTITKKWEKLKMPLESAYDSQALIQLKESYCNLKKCLTCTIGNYLLKKSDHD